MVFSSLESKRCKLTVLLVDDMGYGMLLTKDAAVVKLKRAHSLDASELAQILYFRMKSPI